MTTDDPPPGGFDVNASPRLVADLPHEDRVVVIAQGFTAEQRTALGLDV